MTAIPCQTPDMTQEIQAAATWVVRHIHRIAGDRLRVSDVQLDWLRFQIEKTWQKEQQEQRWTTKVYSPDPNFSLHPYTILLQQGCVKVKLGDNEPYMLIYPLSEHEVFSMSDE